MFTFPPTCDRLNLIRNQYPSDVLLRTRIPTVAWRVPYDNKSGKKSNTVNRKKVIKFDPYDCKQLVIGHAKAHS